MNNAISRPVTVVVPTHNRSASLRRTLDSLRAQTYPADRIRVVVVLDGCVDDTRNALDGYACAFDLQIVELGGMGPAEARNRGAAYAISGILVFLDDDMVAEPGLLAGYARAHEGASDRVALGPIVPTFDRPNDFFTIALRQWWGRAFDGMQQAGHRFTYRDLMTGNVSMDATLFHRLGGFDTGFSVHEDYELGIRLLAAGARLTFVPEAVVHHHDDTTLDRLIKRKTEEGRADVRIAALYPALRPSFPFGRQEATNRRSRVLLDRSSLAGNGVTAASKRLLDLYERTKQRTRWRGTLNRLLGYWYWRGVISEAAGRSVPAPAASESSGFWDLANELELDLREGMEIAERSLDAERPAAARIRYGTLAIGTIPAVPGAEPLRGDHLRQYLVSDAAAADALIKALVFDGQFAPFTTRADNAPATR